MGCRLLNESFIRQRSKELQIPFENLLAASVLEEIVQRMMESEYAQSFWMKNCSKLNLENYRKKVDLNLVFYIDEKKGLPYKKKEISSLFASLFRNVKKDAVHWNYQVWMDWGIIYIDVTAAISSIKVPVKIKLECLTDHKIHPCMKDIQLFTNNNRKIKIKCYPAEYVIAEKFLEILGKLELVNDVSCYMDIYEILKRETLSGRKVCELMREGCLQQGMEVNMDRYKLLLSYRTNSFMTKKWKAYLRHEKRKNPEWNDVFDLMEKFFTFIWESMCQGFIYLGDWMPELGRFIE